MLGHFTAPCWMLQRVASHLSLFVPLLMVYCTFVSGVGDRRKVRVWEVADAG
jgi:hypothetical protein